METNPSDSNNFSSPDSILEDQTTKESFESHSSTITMTSCLVTEETVESPEAPHSHNKPIDKVTETKESVFSNSDVEIQNTSGITSEDKDEESEKSPIACQSSEEKHQHVEKSDDVLQIPESIVTSVHPTSSTGSETLNNQEKTSVYKLKTIKWGDNNIPLITQNENGPCPLIAIINVMLLIGRKNVFGSKQVVTLEDLMTYLGDMIIRNSPQSYSSESAQLNYEQNMADAISIFPKLQTGLDVNVKFTGVRDFEYTPECIIFDLLNIPLYHGWLVDPQAKDVEKAVGKLSYNQLVEKIITNKCSSEPDLVTEALVAESFLERSASQLTHYGLCELNNVMNSGEMAVFFRNNHFSTIYKHKNELFQLVTDQGFLHESNVVWETLSNIDGDGEFVDSAFVTVPPKPVPVGNVVPADPINPEEQIKQDFMVALSLQKEESRKDEVAANWEEYKAKELGVTSEITDEELAWKLQEDERKQAQNENESRRAPPAQAAEPLPKQSSNDGNAGHSSKRKSDCTIL